MFSGAEFSAPSASPTICANPATLVFVKVVSPDARRRERIGAREQHLAGIGRRGAAEQFTDHAVHLLFAWE